MQYSSFEFVDNIVDKRWVSGDEVLLRLNWVYAYVFCCGWFLLHGHFGVKAVDKYGVSGD